VIDPASYTYQWSRDGVEISKAVSSSYTVQRADQGRQLTCAVRADNPAGSTQVTSRATDEVVAAIFFDEFSGAAVDTTRWSVESWSKPGTAFDLETYDPSACTVADGVLSIRATALGTYPTAHYVSGRMQSLTTFTYGTVTVVAKLPKGNGLWPAIWLASDPGPPEIDILENGGSDTFNGQSTYITGPDYSDVWHTVTVWQLPGNIDLSLDYHTYVLEWAEDGLTWSVDGFTVKSFTAEAAAAAGTSISQVPMFVVLNLAVGSSSCPFGTVDQTTSFPAEFNVKSVLVSE
jgi:beta-glucanase (GH16 family)